VHLFKGGAATVPKTADSGPPKNGGRPPKGPPAHSGGQRQAAVSPVLEERTKVTDKNALMTEDAKKADRGIPVAKSRPADRRSNDNKNLRREEQSLVPKFPVTMRESVYDNVKDVSDNEDDEGIDNDYSDDSGTPPKVSGRRIDVILGRLFIMSSYLVNNS
jgi:hypothetical protein